MIDPKAHTTYAQFNEDTILLALLHDVNKGFYVDIGANYPTVDSVTKTFYDKGWCGINIEPLKDLYEQIKKERPKDINLDIGVGDKNETKIFYENPQELGHSSFLKEQAGATISKLSKREVTIKRLDSILKEHTKNTHIHFMKIDVEGFEAEVIRGNDWKKYRPEVLCIESNHAKEDWRKILVENDYKLFIADGLNEYYIAKESWFRVKGYEERAVNISYHTLRQHQAESWREDSKHLEKLINLNEEKEQIIKRLNNEIQDVASLSMKNVGYTRRLKVAILGLTVDWVNFKKGKK